MKSLAVKLSGIGAVLICIPVMISINKGDAYNPASFFLWALLSVVCTIVLWRAKKGGHVLMAGYTVSDASIGTYAFVKSGKAIFGTFEWCIAGLVVVCIAAYLWCESRKKFTPSVIINGIACMIAGIPLIVDSFHSPHTFSFMNSTIYLTLSSLGFYGETSFNGKFIPGLSMAYWIVAMVGVFILR
jgi:hypothetical protein